ncbi:hypothetical protein BH09MYX1_BH09MYX1_60980 [soil metagenome]
MRSFTIAISTTLASIALAAPALANDTPLAETLFREGRQLMDQHRYAAACPKIAESQRLDPADGTILALGVCHEAQGLLATAWGDYLDAATAAHREGQVDREEAARSRATEMEPRLPRLVIRVAKSLPELEVKRDANGVAQVTWGVAVPVDPGPHVIEASAPGHEPFRREVTATIGQVTTIDIVLDLSKSAPPKRAISGVRIFGATALGVGAALVAVGAAFGIAALTLQNDVRARGCDATRCTDQGAADDNARVGVFADVSTVLFATGLGLAAIGVVFLVLPSSTGAPTAALSIGGRF